MKLTRRTFLGSVCALAGASRLAAAADNVAVAMLRNTPETLAADPRVRLTFGDVLTTRYGWLEGDAEPSGYTPTMRKTRVMLLRSRDRGRHWDFVSTVAADSKVGTEGFGEAVLARVSRGPRAGRLICMMRTGR